VSPTPLPHLSVFYFGIPANTKLLSYWDIVADCLFKVRHCMNIEGAVRQLPLFEPPIDPGLLVKAAAAGIDLSSVLGMGSLPSSSTASRSSPTGRWRCAARSGRWGSGCWPRWSAATLTAAAMNAGVILGLAGLLAGGVAGDRAGRVSPRHRHMVCVFVVKREYRGRGIGGHLLSSPLPVGTGPWATLCSNPAAPARQIYQRWGWEKAGTAEFPGLPPMDILVRNIVGSE